MPTVQALVTQSYLSDIADAIRAKNGAVTTYTPSQMAAAITAIPSGGGVEPATADASGAIVKGAPLSFDGVTSIAAYGLQNKFKGASWIGSVAFPDLVTVSNDYSLQNTFKDCLKLTDAYFPELVTISGTRAFWATFGRENGTQSLQTITFPKLERVTGNNGMRSCFSGSTNVAITSAYFPELVELGVEAMIYAFWGGSNLETVTFPKLATVASNGLASAFTNTKIQTISFPSLSNASSTSMFDANTFTGCSQLSEIHFPAGLQSFVESITGYSTLWGRGAGNATVYYDL